jgi:diazepam-binding inhibitor (GABA receptor modulating acyl-CoA-binding protein)
MELRQKFEEAVINAKKLSAKPSNDVLLRLYALYKQVTEGDVHGEKPGGFDFKAIAKYNSWEELKGTSKEDAMNQYIVLIDNLSK